MQEPEKKRKIVVMGGSFNPPTIAHLRLMQAAVDGIGAEKGIFVPSNHTYVKIKMRRAKHPDEVYSEEMRMAMLQEMCEEDSRLEADDVEYEWQGGRTYETMEHIQSDNSDAELYFIAGGDKLNILPRWRSWSKFAAKFKFIVFSRDGADPIEQILANERLRGYKDIFTILMQPEGVEDISSTAVREKVRNGESAQHLLHSGVWRLVQQHGTFRKKENR